MLDEVDDQFYNRADAHKGLSNKQIAEVFGSGVVSASFMFSLARFNAWISDCGWSNGEEMKQSKAETIEYFMTEYKKMLEENMDDYIDNFDSYMQTSQK